MSFFTDIANRLGENEINEINNKIYDLNRNSDEYWDFMLENSLINPTTIINNLENINIKNLMRKKQLPADVLSNQTFLNKVKKEKAMNLLLKYQNMNISQIEKVMKLFDDASEINWNWICKYQNLTVEFMNSNKDKLNWDLVSEFQLLTIQFIAGNMDKINWSLIGDNLKTRYLYNDSFMKLFSNKPIWNCLIWSDKISKEFLLENINNLSYEEINDLFKYKTLDKETIDNILKNISYPIDANIVNSIVEGQSINQNFIDKYIDYIDFNNLVSNQKLTYSFINKNKKSISLKQLSYNDDFDEEMLLNIYSDRHNFKEDFDWEFISECIDLSKETINQIKEINKSSVIMKDLLKFQ